MMQPMGEVTVRYRLNICDGCQQTLDQFPDEVIALVLDDLGTNIRFFHVTHAPESVRVEHERQEAAL